MSDGSGAASVGLRLLGPDDAAELQAVFEAAGDHFLRVTGRPAPAPDAAERELSSVASTDGREVALVVQRGARAPTDGSDAAENAVGAIGWWAGHPEPDLALLGMLMIARPHRGSGFARRALERLEERLRTAGISRLRTAVAADDRESHGFVEALGFAAMDQRTRVDLDSGRLRIAFFEKGL